MKKNNKNESLVKHSNQNSTVNESAKDSGIVKSDNFISGKSKFLSKIERKYDITIEPTIIICGIDTSVIEINEFQEMLGFKWKPIPKECYENSTDKLMTIDLFNCDNIDEIETLKNYGFSKRIFNFEGKMFEEVDLLINISKNGITKAFDINHTFIQHMFDIVNDRTGEFNQLSTVIKDYFNNVYSIDEDSYILDNWIFDYCYNKEELYKKIPFDNKDLALAQETTLVVFNNMTNAEYDKIIEKSIGELSRENIAIFDLSKDGNHIFFIYEGDNWCKILNVPNTSDFSINYYLSMAEPLYEAFGDICCSYDELVEEFKILLQRKSFWEQNPEAVNEVFKHAKG